MDSSKTKTQNSSNNNKKTPQRTLKSSNGNVTESFWSTETGKWRGAEPPRDPKEGGDEAGPQETAQTPENTVMTLFLPGHTGNSKSYLRGTDGPGVKSNAIDKITPNVFKVVSHGFWGEKGECAECIWGSWDMAAGWSGVSEGPMRVGGATPRVALTWPASGCHQASVSLH